MDFVELSEEFFELENDLDLLNKKIGDTYFWERVRFSVHQRISRSLASKEAESGGDKPSEYISAGSLLLKNLFRKNPFLSNNTDLLFYGTGRRKKLDDDLWWDIYHDPVIESVDDNCLLLERPYNVSHLTPAKTPNLRYVDLIEYTGTLLQKAGLSTVSFSANESSLIKQIEKEINTRFGVQLHLESLVKEDLSKRKARLPLYRRLVSRINPDVALLITSYNGRETFVEACQMEYIPVAELQHGAFSRYHLGYSYPYNEKNVFPDYFFTFGEFWSELVDFPLPEERVYSVGYPYIEMEAEKYENVDTNDQTVFISQWSIGKELSRFAIELNELEEYEKDIVYKLHPREYDSWEQRYPWLANGDLRVVDSDDPPLYRLFAESTAQVGVGSTAIYEGLNFNLNTYVLDIPSEKHKLEYLIEKGYAELVSSTDEMLDHSGTDGNQNFDREVIFETDAINNVKEYIKIIQTKNK